MFCNLFCHFLFVLFNFSIFSFSKFFHCFLLNNFCISCVDELLIG